MVFSTTAVAGGNGYAGADAGSVAPSPVEISAPMSQGFSFMRQKRAFLPDMRRIMELHYLVSVES